MALPSWALTFPMLGSLQYPEPFLTPSLEAPVALTSHWHRTLVWACADNRPIGLWYFLFALQLSLGSFLTAHHCCSEWKNSFLVLGIKSGDNSLDSISHWKWGLPSGPMRCSLVCPKDVWQLFYQFSLCVIQPLLKPTHYDLIDSFSLSIPLRICRGEISIHYAQVTAISPESFAIKLKSVVRDEGTRDSKPSDNIFPNESLSIHFPNIRQWFIFNPFGEVVCADQQISLIPCCPGRRTYNVQAPLSKWLKVE